MENNDFVSKIINNKVLLFIIPNLIYFSNLLYYYNCNFESLIEVLFSEVIILSLVFFAVTSIIYLFLNKFLKDKQKIFLVLIFICAFYCIKLSLVYTLIFVVFVLILILNMKKFINFRLDKINFIIGFIISAIFLYNFAIASSHALYMTINSKTFDNDIDIKVEDDTKTPNIYWIHCDGMLSVDGMRKYFNFYNAYLVNYFNNNNFRSNDYAILVAGHKTQKALVAMFNPYYYDNFFKDYLTELEESYLDNSKKTSFVVDYYELEEKRLDNELFEALDEKDYTTIAISEFNPYSSLDTDYFYDYYYYGENVRHIDENNNEFRKLTNNSEDKLLSYIRFVHLKPLANRTILYDIVGKANYLNYDLVDYKNFDTSNYKFTDKVMKNSNYWLSTAILKGLDDSFKINGNKFTFVDFRANHDPYTFNEYGDIIHEELQYNVDRYLYNYIYSTYLLTEMLDFIKSNDEDAVIIVQADHGLHTITDEEMLRYFNTDMEGVQEIRNSVVSAYYIPDKFKNGDEKYLDNPLNISRYLVNNYVGKNYEYID